jgi:hypothetical protein
MNAGESARLEARRARERAERLARRAEVFEKGADGEVRTAQTLALLGPDWVVLHDHRWPGRRFANIDHVVVGPGGIFIIDSKNWSGDIRVVNGALRRNGRSNEKDVASAADAALAVAELAPAYASLIRPVLCFTGGQQVSGWVRDVMICSTSNVLVMLRSRPPVLVPARVKEVATRLDAQLRSATEPWGGRPAVHTVSRATPPPAVRAGAAARSRRRKSPSLGRVATGLTLAAVTVLAGPTYLPPVANAFTEFLTGQVAPNTDECTPKQRARQSDRKTEKADRPPQGDRRVTGAIDCTDGRPAGSGR